ncbi:MAG: hypothetical protein H6906_06060 [Hyphomicrobiales bacterium]|nr:hypothetical protein [Hyphomicrobiales bacterium]
MQMYLKEPGDLNVEGSGAAFLGGLKKDMEERYQHLLKLATGMIEMGLDRKPSSTLKVTDKFRFDIDLRPRTGLDGPTADEFSKLVRKYQWELVPIDEAGTPDKNPDCQTYPVDEPYWFTEHVTQQPDQPKLSWLKRATHAGKFRLRVIALGDNDVPLARSSLRDILVEPATLSGKLEASGDWKTGADPVSVFMGAKGGDKGHPRFRLTAQGDFEAPVPLQRRRRVAQRGLRRPGGRRPERPARQLPAQPLRRLRRGGEAACRQPQRSRGHAHRPEPARTAGGCRLRGRGQVQAGRAAEDPLPAHRHHPHPGHRRRGVEVTGAEITVTAGTETLTGAGPFQVELDKGTRVSGTVKFEKGEISIERRTRVITYDPATMGNEIELKTGLPLFDTGNLRVTGQFVPKPDPDAPAPPPIAGGRLKTNVHAEPIAVRGGIFEFSNDAPVLLSTTLTIAAVLRGGDDRLMKPVVSPYSYRLRVGPGCATWATLTPNPSPWTCRSRSGSPTGPASGCRRATSRPPWGPTTTAATWSRPATCSRAAGRSPSGTSGCPCAPRWPWPRARRCRAG